MYTLRAVHAVQLRIIQGPSGMDGGGGKKWGEHNWGKGGGTGEDFRNRFFKKPASPMTKWDINKSKKYK